MSGFEFVSHESFPEDEWIKEVVYLLLEGKFRVAYIRKKMKSGGLFWEVVTAGALKRGEKQWIKGFSQDSNFLREDIMHFLESRGWEKKQEVSENELPF